MPWDRLSYCSNVHPYRSLPELLATLSGPVAEVARLSGGSSPFPVGLWWPETVVDALAGTREQEALAERLASLHFEISSLNVFPQAPFHESVVKSRVYQPAWWDASRLNYTVRAAEILASLLPPGRRASLSTLAGGFRPELNEGRKQDWARQVTLAAQAFERLADDRGADLCLAIEPEPFTGLETTGDVVEFFDGPLAKAVADLAPAGRRSALEAVVRRRVGVCLDICHLAVLFEDMGAAVERLRRAEIRIAKVQISAALSLKNPADDQGFAALRACHEGRYLHQTAALWPSGERSLVLDIQNIPESFRQARELRTHFHVPIFAESLGRLATTQGEIRAAFAALARAEIEADGEVETYTWSVLPQDCGGLVQGIARELAWVRENAPPRGSL